MRASTAIIVTSATLALGAPAAQAGLELLPAKKPAVTHQALAAKHSSSPRAHKKVSKTQTVKPATTSAAPASSTAGDGSSNRSGAELTQEQSAVYADDCDDDV